MTFLEQIIAQQTSTTTVTTLSRATEKIAEEMAQEIIRDPKFKADLREFVARAFSQTLTRLNETAKDEPAKA
jgi:hypothetical protein